ncbi:hypothetical protein ONO86_03033 [Micromonospora noduli]|nr:hypothetical protein ONO86_03033 [Micromonospora noduli]
MPAPVTTRRPPGAPAANATRYRTVMPLPLHSVGFDGDVCAVDTVPAPPLTATGNQRPPALTSTATWLGWRPDRLKPSAVRSRTHPSVRLRTATFTPCAEPPAAKLLAAPTRTES